MAFLKNVCKLCIFIFYNIAYIVQASWILATIRDKRQKRLALLQNISRWTGRAMKLGHFNIIIEGKENLPDDGKTLIVSNHLSYVDVFLLSQVCPSVFITSYEVRDAFFMGYLCKLGSTLFIDRRSRHGLLNEIEEISKTVNNGFPVIFFPEGTSSNGEDILPFKSSFMALAKSANVGITPICIKYETINNESISEKNRDKVFYYGDVSFFPQYPNLSLLKEVTVRLTVLPQLSPEMYERKELAQKAREIIRESYFRDSK